MGLSSEVVAIDSRFVSPSECYSPLLQAKLNFHDHDSYRLAYLSLVTRDNFDKLQGQGVFSGLFLTPPAQVDTSWSVFHQAQIKEMEKISLNVDQERERSLSILGLDAQAGKIIHDCLSGGLGLTYSYWSTSKTSTVLQLNWKGQGAIPLRITKSHLQNAKSKDATGRDVLFDGPITIRESKTIILARIDPNDDIVVQFDTEPQIQYDPPIIAPFPKRRSCVAHTYTQDPVTNASYSFRKSFDVNQEQYLHRDRQSILGTDLIVEFYGPSRWNEDI